jgi:DNA-binding MarR family transcriptional regulator
MVSIGRGTGSSTARSRASAPEASENDVLNDAVERLLRAGIGITALAIGQVDGATDLTLSQWRALVIASDSDGIRVGELAARLGIAVPSASRLVRRVVDRGLVTATRDDRDRRATIVRQTTAGKRLTEAVMARRRALVASALSEVPRVASNDAASAVGAIAERLARFS